MGRLTTARARGGRPHCSARVGVAWESPAGQSEAGGVARGNARFSLAHATVLSF